LGVGACGKVGVAGRRTCVADFIYQPFQFGLVRLGVRGVEGAGVVGSRVRCGDSGDRDPLDRRPRSTAVIETGKEF
jgi:hypothetical protein